jgi:hypothetical protein
MHEITIGVAQQLHLDMAGAAHQFLQIHFIIAKRRLRLALGGNNGFQQHALIIDRPHAAAATAPGCLQHYRIADLSRQALNLLTVVR